MKNPELVITQDEEDSIDLKRLGYVQELLRDMGGFSSFAVSFSVISIVTGITQLYGYGLQHGGPAQFTFGWILVSIFSLCVALSMAELASAYPTAGALYHWSSFLGGRRWGWFTASFNTIGQFAILAGIDYGLAQFLVAIGALPNSQTTINIVYISLLLSHAFLNHMGIRIVAKLNDFSAWYHIAVVFVLVGALLHHGFVQPVSFLFKFSSADGFPKPYSFIVGLLLAQWTFTGYDASAHITEETHNPKKNAPWGIFNAVVCSMIFGLIMLVAVTLSIQDLPQATGFGDSAFIEIIKGRLGSFGGLIIYMIAGAMWLCGLATMTSASRMVFAFARDGGLPKSAIWARVSKKYRTPSNAIWGLAFIAMVLALSVSLYSAVVSIATIALYISYGLPIAARLYTRFKEHPKKYKDEIGPWNLGRFSNFIAFVALFWVGFVMVDFILPPNQQAGIVMGGFFIFLLILWFAVARRKFVGPKYHL